MDKCRSIVWLFNHSTIMNKALKDAQLKFEDKPLRLIQDVVTRWNSLYKMLERLIKLNNYVSTVLDMNHKYSDRKLTNEDIEKLTQIVAVLKPFYLVAEKLSGEKYFTRSHICSSIMKLYSDSKIESNDSDFTKTFKKTITEGMTHYFEKYEFIEKDFNVIKVCT